MTLVSGTRLGPYEIVGPIGAGGMGEVYRATDSHLKRSVAIKVLPASVAADADRLARFQREAEVLAALNHPNIAAIHGLEKTADLAALVMELVEGEDLSVIVARGPRIPLADALPIAKQIAHALEAAHEQGIIHRDLKPANIKVRADGTVKVLDFGLAKATEPAASSSPSVSMSPTLSLHATQAGVILGTAAYMSPEQASGKPVDRRSDLWAFGVVLLEMLTGRRVFDGETVSHVLAAVLTKEPDWSALPSETPASIRKLLRRCLEKDRKKRLDSAAAARLEIEDALTTPGIDAATVMAASGVRAGRLAWSIAGAAVIAAAILGVPAVRHLRESPPAAAPETRLEISTPATSDALSLALSPDGRHVAFVASGDGVPRLWLRSLELTTAQPLAGTEGASFPFWSPDSRSIAFQAGQQLKRLDLGGGPPRTIATGVIRGGTWNAAGVILYGTTAGSLARVDASGGSVVEVTTPGRNVNPKFPVFLPDGRRFLYYGGATAPEPPGVYVAALDSAEVKRLAAADTAAVYLSTASAGAERSDWLVWVRAGTLVAQRFDMEQQSLFGEPLTLAEGVAFDAAFSTGAVSVAASGALVYRSGTNNRRQLTWFDRTGKTLGTLGPPEDADLQSPSLSPDGRRVAVTRSVNGNADIWLMDGTRTSRLTFDPGLDNFPAWSDDQILFRSNRSGSRNLYVKPSAGAETERLLVETGALLTPSDVSADQRWLLYMSLDPQSDHDLWLLPSKPGDLAAAGKPQPFLRSPFAEKWGRFSPDGQWVAYHSNESGRYEVFVRPMTLAASADSAAGAPGGQWQVSVAGGAFPVWKPDGRAVYYVAPSGTMMEVAIAVRGASLEAEAPVSLFPSRIYGGGTENGQGRQYDVTRDGRFLVNTILDTGAAAPITLIQNWRPR